MNLRLIAASIFLLVPTACILATTTTTITAHHTRAEDSVKTAVTATITDNPHIDSATGDTEATAE